MSRATSLIAKVGNVLTKVNATNRDVYKRIISQSGGDPLLGRGVLTDTQDILLVPPPAMRVVGPEDTFLLTTKGVTPDGTLILTVSPDAISRQELEDPAMSIVMKGDSEDNEEEFFISAYNFDAFQGIDVLYELLIRSKSR